MLKKVVQVRTAHAPHMVGDGLPVRNVFSYTDLGRSELSPFLMLDYGYPSAFEPTEEKLGVGMHPHRGFETVTFAFQGEIEHKDTAGNRGVIVPGDVQWMTAASGVLHEEMHSQSFRKNGGMLEMAQLWVNLPAKDKMSNPKYQSITAAEIPNAPVDNLNGHIRVVAGELAGVRGPASTFTEMNLWDLYLNAGAFDFSLKAGHTAAIFVVDGQCRVNGSELIESVNLVVLERENTDVSIVADGAGPCHLLVLSGEPINEPVVGYGPFVMNTKDEIAQAIDDFNKRRFVTAGPAR